MDFVIEDELERLIELLKEEKMSDDKANNFISFDDYEDEYSHNDIEKCQSEFIKQASKYLRENYNGQYIILSDWCVHIVTNNFYARKQLHHGIKC